MKLDIDRVNQYITEGKLIANKHPEYPLLILNYSRTTQYNKYWDDLTLMCRGVVIDEDGNVLSRPLGKFFNYEEQEGKYAIDYKNQDKKPIKAFIKYDGCLITTFWYEKESTWIVTSRGSFDSEYSNRAEVCIKDRGYVLDDLCKKHTYCFELTSPDNRIVIKYFDTDLTMLAAIHTESAKDWDLDDFDKTSNFKLAKQVELILPNYKSLHLTKALNLSEQEGFVLKQNNQRCKIKFENYCKLHSYKASITDNNILDCLIGKSESITLETLLETAPDEMDAEIKAKIKFFKNKYKELEEYYQTEYLKYKDIPNDKYFARDVKFVKNKHILFNLRKNEDYSKGIWSIIEQDTRKTARLKQESARKKYNKLLNS